MTESSEGSVREGQRWKWALPLLLGLALGTGCSSKNDEPPAPADSGRPSSIVKMLDLKVPQSWRTVKESIDEIRRAEYAVPALGGDKEDAEMLVLFYGTGANGDRDKVWGPWFEQFDGDAKKDATRSQLDASGSPVEMFEFAGTYKLNTGPRRPGQKKALMQVVKEHFRMLGAVLHTKDRGNWYFRLVGPDATVEAAKSDFIALVQSAH